MNEGAKKRTLEGLTKAIEAERNGHTFYMMTAAQTQDDKGREVFRLLADEELEHETYLKAHYQSIMEHGHLDRGARLHLKTDLSGDHPIFSAGLKERAKDAHVEMTALSIGVQLELNAQTFYKAEAEATDDPEIKAFYMELSDWESTHYHALLKEQQNLREAYWADSGFSPF
jgi:rubrerythrin